MTMLIALLLSAAAHPCAEDAQRLCTGVKPGQGRVMACLKQHAADLSPECKAAGGKLREGHGGRGHGDEHQGKDQDGDGKGHDDGDDRGGKGHDDGDDRGGKDHDDGDDRGGKGHEQGEDGGDRQGHGNAGHGKKQHGEGAGKGRAMAACRADAQKLCADVKPGGGRIIDCLQQQQAQVSAGCAAALPK
jgi:hypothetical protein